MITIDVTLEDIRQGTPASGELCAVALAAKRVLLPEVKVYVDGEFLVLWKKTAQIAIPIPVEAEQWIDRWDNTSLYYDPARPLARPIQFQVRIPDEWLKKEFRENAGAVRHA